MTGATTKTINNVIGPEILIFNKRNDNTINTPITIRIE